MKNRTIYVRLLDEGTEVFRPAEAVEQAPGVYELIAPVGYEASDERWEFPPGSLVQIAPRIGSGDTIQVAVSRVTTD